MRLIDADHFKREFNMIDGFAGCADISENTRIGLNMMIDDEPTVEAAPIKHAHWKKLKEQKNRNIVQCSKCGNLLDIRGVNAGRGDAKE